MPVTSETTAAGQAALRDQCSTFLTGHGPVRPADMLATIPVGTAVDRYGDGGLATRQGIWTWPQAMATIDPGVQRVELSVGDATCALRPEQIRDVIVTLAGPEAGR